MFSNRNLATKIYALVALILLMLAGTSTYSLYQMSLLGAEIKEIAEEDVPLLNKISTITIHQEKQAVEFERVLRYALLARTDNHAAENQVKAVEDFENLSMAVNLEIKEGEALADKGGSLGHNAEARKKFASVGAHFAEIEKKHLVYEKNVHEVFALTKKGKIEEAEAAGEQIEALEEDLGNYLEAFTKDIGGFTAKAALQAEHDERFAPLVILIASGAVLLFSSLFSVFIVRSITGPLKK